MTLSGTICTNSYNPFDPASGVSLYETHMRKQIGDEIVGQVLDPSAASISLSPGCFSSLSPPAATSPAQDLVESTMRGARFPGAVGR